MQQNNGQVLGLIMQSGCQTGGKFIQMLFIYQLCPALMSTVSSKPFLQLNMQTWQNNVYVFLGLLAFAVKDILCMHASIALGWWQYNINGERPGWCNYGWDTA